MNMGENYIDFYVVYTKESILTFEAAKASFSSCLLGSTHSFSPVAIPLSDQ